MMPTWTPAPSRPATVLTVFGSLEPMAAVTASIPTFVSIPSLTRSPPCRAMACATSCPMTVARPASSLATGRSPV